MTTDYGKDLKPLELVTVNDLVEEGGIPPRSEDYAIFYRKRVYRVPAGSRVEVEESSRS